MRNIAIIPARGGSKRIPGKNIKEFLGKPILAYSIEAALQSGIFDEVMVSTDDEEIAAVARKYGAKVPFLRSAETANDYAPLAAVIDEVIGKYRENDDEYDYFCCLLSTAPFVKPEDLVGAYETLKGSDFDTIRPVVRFDYPIQRAFRMAADGCVTFFNPEYAGTRSQDLEPAFHDAGLFYMGKFAKGLHDDLRRAGFVISSDKCQDIDTEEDWRIAEIKYKLLSE